MNTLTHTGTPEPVVDDIVGRFLREAIPTRPLLADQEVHDVIEWYKANCPLTQASTEHHKLNDYEFNRILKNIEFGVFNKLQKNSMHGAISAMNAQPSVLRFSQYVLVLWLADVDERVLFKLTWG